MIKYILLILFSISAQAQVVEVSNQSLSIRSKDKFYGGELTSTASVNPQIVGRYDFLRGQGYSLFVEGKLQYLMLNGQFIDNKQITSALDLGIKFKLTQRASFEFLAGSKDLILIESSGTDYRIKKVQALALSGRGSLAIDRYGDFTVFGEGLFSIYPAMNGVKGNDIGIGLAVGHYLNSDNYLKVGYRLEYDLVETDQISTGMWRNSVYLKINF